MSDTQKKESKTASSANDSQSSNANQWKPPKKPNNPAHKAMIEAKRKEAHARRRLYLARKKEAYATASIVDNLLSSVCKAWGADSIAELPSSLVKDVHNLLSRNGSFSAASPAPSGSSGHGIGNPDSTTTAGGGATAETRTGTRAPTQFEFDLFQTLVIHGVTEFSAFCIVRDTAAALVFSAGADSFQHSDSFSSIHGLAPTPNQNAAASALAKGLTLEALSGHSEEAQASHTDKVEDGDDENGGSLEGSSSSGYTSSYVSPAIGRRPAPPPAPEDFTDPFAQKEVTNSALLLGARDEQAAAQAARMRDLAANIPGANGDYRPGWRSSVQPGLTAPVDHPPAPRHACVLYSLFENQPAGVPESTQHYNLGLLLHTPPDEGAVDDIAHAGGGGGRDKGAAAATSHSGGSDNEEPDDPPVKPVKNSGEYEPTMEELKRACWHYEQSVKHEPNNAPALYNWALVRGIMGKREAIEKGQDAPDLDRTAEQYYAKAAKLSRACLKSDADHRAAKRNASVQRRLTLQKARRQSTASSRAAKAFAGDKWSQAAFAMGGSEPSTPPIVEEAGFERLHVSSAGAGAYDAGKDNTNWAPREPFTPPSPAPEAAAPAVAGVAATPPRRRPSVAAFHGDPPLTPSSLPSIPGGAPFKSPSRGSRGNSRKDSRLSTSSSSSSSSTNGGGGGSVFVEGPNPPSLTAVNMARAVATASLTNLGNLVLATHAEAGAAEKAMALHKEALQIDSKDARAAFNLACLNHRNFMRNKLESTAGAQNDKNAKTKQRKESVQPAQPQASAATAANDDDNTAMKAVAAQYNRVLELWPQCRPAHLHLGLLYQEGFSSSSLTSTKANGSNTGDGRTFFNDVARVHYREVLRFCGNGRGMHRHPDWPPPRYITEENQGVQAVANAELRAPHWRANLQKAQQQEEARRTASMHFHSSQGDVHGGNTMMTATSIDGQSNGQWGATLGQELRVSVTLTPGKTRASTTGGTLPTMMPLREEATVSSSSEITPAPPRSALQALYSSGAVSSMPPPTTSSWHPHSTLLPTNGGSSNSNNSNSNSRRSSFRFEEPLSPLSPLSPQSPLSPSSRASFSAGFQVTNMVGKVKRRSSISKKALKAAAASASTTAFAEAPYADYRSQVQATRSDGAYALRLALDAHTKVAILDFERALQDARDKANNTAPNGRRHGFIVRSGAKTAKALALGHLRACLALVRREGACLHENVRLPLEADTIYNLAVLRYASGDVPRAAELYRASIAVLPLAESLADAHTGLALALRHQSLEVAAKLKLRGANAEDLWPRILTFDALAEEHLTLALKYKSTNGGKGDDDDEDDEEDEGLSVGLGVVKAERPPPERLRGKPVPSEGRLARLASQRIAFERRRTAAASPSSSTSAVEGGSGNFHQQMVPSNRRRRASSARMASNASMSASGQRAPTGAMVEMKTAPGAAEEAARDNIIIEDDDQGFDWKIVAKGELEVLQLTKVAIPAVLLEIRDNGPRLKTWQKKKPK